MAMDDGVNFLLEGRVQMRQVHILTHQCFVLLDNKSQVVQRVDGCLEIRLRMTELSKDRPAIYAMKHMIIVVGLVGEPSAVQEHVKQMLAAFRLWCNSVIQRKLRARVKCRYPMARCPAIAGVTCG